MAEVPQDTLQELNESDARNQVSELLKLAEANPGGYDPNQLASEIGTQYGDFIAPQEYLGALENIYGPGDTWAGDQTSSTSGDGGTDATLNQAAIDNTMKAIASLDDELNVGYGNIDENFGSVMSQYDRERGRTREDYEEQGTTNTKNLQKNKQNALVSGAQGLRGLRGVLSSIGALSGDGDVLASRAVTTEANQDIGGATDTYAANAQNLDRAWSRFDEEDDQRRAEAETAKRNQRTALEGDVASKRQNFFQKIAELYGEAGNTDQATSFLDKAGDLNETIARKSRVASTPITARGAAFTPGDLESYLAGAGDMTVDVQEGGAGGSGGPTSVLAGRRGRSNEDERRRRQQPAFA